MKNCKLSGPAFMQNNVIYGIVSRQRTNSLLKELFRKSIHLCSSLVPLFLSLAYWPMIWLLCFGLAAYSFTEYLRLKGHTVPIITKITETAARKRDENRFVLGPVTLVIGILIAALVLPFESARVGIFALAFGDGLASLTGRMFGRITIPGAHGKTVAGSLTCFVAVYAAVFFCCGTVFISLLVAVFAMLLEALPLADFDNILIPICVGSFFYLLHTAL